MRHRTLCSACRKSRNHFWTRWNVRWTTVTRRTWRTSTSWRSSSSSRHWSTASTRHRATRPSPSRPSPEDPARTRSPSILRDVDRSPRLRSAPRCLEKKEEGKGRETRKSRPPIREDDEGTIVVLDPVDPRKAREHASLRVRRSPAWAPFPPPPREGVATPDINNGPVESRSLGTPLRKRAETRTNCARLSWRSKGLSTIARADNFFTAD